MPAWLTVLVQIGNLVSIVYAFIVQRHVPSKYAFVPIVLALSVAPILGILIALFWKATTNVGGHEYSLLLSSLGACAGLVGGLSTVTLYPWASLYGATMVAAVSSGSGANGIFTAIFAIAQNPTDGAAKAHFSMQTYFFILSGLLLLSIASFIIVTVVPSFERWKAPTITNSILNDNNSLFSSYQNADEDDYLAPNQLNDSFKRNHSSTRFDSLNYSRAALLSEASPESGKISPYTDNTNDGLDDNDAYASSGADTTASESKPGSISNYYYYEGREADPYLESQDVATALLGDGIHNSAFMEDEGYLASETALFLRSQEPARNEIPMRSLLWHIRSPIMYQFYINLLYYCILGMIPFAFGKQTEHRSRQFIFWTNISGMVLNAAGRLVTFKWRYFYPRSFSLAQTPFFVFIFVICFLQKFHIPQALYYFVVVAFAGFSFLFGYADTINFQYPIKLLEGLSSEIQRASKWVAVANQLGSLCGAMIGFLLCMTVLVKPA